MDFFQVKSFLERKMSWSILMYLPVGNFGKKWIRKSFHPTKTKTRKELVFGIENINCNITKVNLEKEILFVGLVRLEAVIKHTEAWNL